MPTINFTQFIDKVVSGEKRQTIRKCRKHPFKVGDKLYLYSGLRTKGACNLLAGYSDIRGQITDVVNEQEITYYTEPNGDVYVLCKEVHDIEIIPFYYDSANLSPSQTDIFIDTIIQNWEEMRQLAKLDGFSDNVIDFLKFFEKTHGFPFKGQVVRW